MAHEFSLGSVQSPLAKPSLAEKPLALPEFSIASPAVAAQPFSEEELETLRAAKEQNLLTADHQRRIVEREQSGAAPPPLTSPLDPVPVDPITRAREAQALIPPPEPLEEASAGILSRPLFVGVGGVAGTAGGIPAAPSTLGLSLPAGGALGAAGGSMTFDLVQDVAGSLGLIEPSKLTTEDKLRIAAREGAIDTLFAGVASGIRPLLGARQILSKWFSLNRPAVRQLMFKADLLGIELGAVDVGGSTPKSAAGALSVFPFSGGKTLREGIQQKQKQAIRAFNRMLNTFAPNATLSGALGIDLGQAARNTDIEFRRISSALFDNFRALSAKASVKDIIPTRHITRVASDLASDLQAGKIFLPITGEELPRVLGGKIKNWMASIEDLPPLINTKQYTRLVEDLQEIMGSAQAAGVDVRNAVIYKEALEFDLNNLRIDLLQPGEGEAIRRSLEVANNFHAKGIIEFTNPTQVPSLRKIVESGDFPDVVVGGRRLTPEQAVEVTQFPTRDRDMLDKTFAVVDTRGGLGVEGVFQNSTQARKFMKGNPNERFLELKSLRRLEAATPGGGGDLIGQLQQFQNLRSTLASLGHKVAVPKVGTVRSTVETLPEGFFGQSTFETAAAGRIKRAQKGIFKTGLSRPGALNEDELANVALNLRSARHVKDLEALVGTKQLRRAARKHLENVKAMSLEQIDLGNGPVDMVNPQKLLKNLGLRGADKGEREALAELLKKGNVKIKDLEDLAEVVDAIEGIGDTRTFVKRRFILGGVTAGVGAAFGVGGAAIGGLAGGITAGSIPIAAMILLATRRGASIMTSRRALGNLTTALDQKVAQSARNQALGRLARFVNRGLEQERIETEREKLAEAKANAADQDEFGVAGQVRQTSEPAPR